jgi:hypothetical protein
MKNFDSYPKTLIESYNLLSGWKDTSRRYQLEPGIDGVNFTTKGDRKGEEEQLANPEKDEITVYD